jgi:hypothetical protein
MELREAHEQILRHGGDVLPVSGGESSRCAGVSVVGDVPPMRQLPMPPTGIVGRDEETEEIVKVLGMDPEQGSPRLVIVSGAEGIGKTAVAIRAAHLLAESFPDGQLFADLQTRGCAARPGLRRVLTRFLQALSLPEAAVPADLEDAIYSYRSLTAGRKILVVLDSVDSAAQVRALLPSSAMSAMLVTSRSDLADLLVEPGGHLVSLGELDVEQGREVLARALGERRILRGGEAVDRLIARCAGQPLALRRAAAQLAARPHLGVGDYLVRDQTGLRGGSS